MSWRRVLLNGMLRRIEKPHLAREKDPVRLRAGFERRAPRLFRVPRGVPSQWIDLPSGIRALHLGPLLGPGPVLLYLHGGAFVMGSPRTHAAMVARLVQLTGLPAVLPQYRLAPEHPFPAAVDDTQAAFAGLLACGVEPGRIILGGDSAGGGLALGLLARTCGGTSRPAGLFAFSPLTDMTFSGPSFQTNADRDCLLPAGREQDLLRFYLRDAAPDHPAASPLFADFSGAPPVFLTVGDSEVLLDDTRRMADRLRAQGVPVEERVEQDLPHVWPIFWRYLPEGDATLSGAADWIKQRLYETGES